MVRVVIVNFNGGTLVERCVASVLDHPPRPGGNDAVMQVVVVDNASTDGSADALERTFAGSVTVARNTTNAGFVAANTAMDNATMTQRFGLPAASVVMLVNPDATVTEGCLTTLVDALDADPRIGAASPCMLFAHRFADVTVDAPSHPVSGDPRDLACRLVGLSVDGLDVARSLHPGGGVHDVEWSGSEPFRWLGAHATIGVPVPLPVHDPPPGGGNHRVCLNLMAPTDVTVHVTAPTAPTAPTATDPPDAGARPDSTRSVGVGPIPADVCVDIPVGGGHERVANAGTVVFTNASGADRGHYQPFGAPYDTPGDLFAWCGGAVALRSGYLNDVGLFDDNLFLYYEDVDLSWRGLRRGWRHVYVPGAVVRHVQGASGGSLSDTFVVHTTRNHLVVALRNASWPVVARAWGVALGHLWASLRYEVVAPLVRARRPQLRMLTLRLRGVVGAVVATPGALGARWRIGRNATVSRATVETGLAALKV